MHGTGALYRCLTTLEGGNTLWVHWLNRLGRMSFTDVRIVQVQGNVTSHVHGEWKAIFTLLKAASRLTKFLILLLTFWIADLSI